VRYYKGISAAEVGCVTMVAPHKVWIRGGLQWPSDIAAHFDWVGRIVEKYNGKAECLKVHHWRRLRELSGKRAA
jgi:hypothetical protein